MKAKDLKQRLLDVATIVSSRSPIPICEYVLFKGKQMIGTNLRSTIFVDVDGAVDGDKEFLLPFKPLKDAVSKLKPTDEVQFRPGALDILNGPSFTFNDDEDPKEFPELPEPITRTQLSFTPDVMTELIKSCEYASKDELRPAMTGVFVDQDNFVATDAHIMRTFAHGYDFSNSKSFNPFIITNNIKTFKRMQKTGAVVTANYNDFQVWFDSERISLCTKIIDEKYPDYKSVYPQSDQLTHMFNIPRPELEVAIGSAEIAANKTTHQVALTFTKAGNLNVHAEDLDFSREFKTDIACATTFPDKSDDSFRIGFNARFILKVLKDNPRNRSAVITFECNAPNRAALMDGVLVMPVMLSNYV